MKTDLYQTVTAKIIAQLEAGTVPWQKPWDIGGLGVNPLRVTGERYRGINVLLLWCAQMEHGHNSPYWMTYRQAAKMEAQVKKGARGEQIVFYSTFEKENDAGKLVKIPFLKGYSVFNVDQIDGLPVKFYPVPVEPTIWEQTDAAEKFFAPIPVDLHHGGGRACYNITHDRVQMPPREAFEDGRGYYNTLAHEYGHWTGAEHRLDREYGKRFGNLAYAAEELVAEMSAAFTCAHIGLVKEPHEQTAAYIANWLKVLKQDKRAIFTAASAADKATQFLIDSREAEKAEKAEKADNSPQESESENVAA